MMWAGRMGLSNPNHVLPPSFFGSEVVAHAINIHYQTSTEIWSIMLSQEAAAFESLSQRIVTNLSACGNKRERRMWLNPRRQGSSKAYQCRHPRMWRFSLSSVFHVPFVHWLHPWLETDISGIFTTYLPLICHQHKYLWQIKWKGSTSLFFCKSCSHSLLLSVTEYTLTVYRSRSYQACRSASRGSWEWNTKTGLFCTGWCAVQHERKGLLKTKKKIY